MRNDNDDLTKVIAVDSQERISDGEIQPSMAADGFLLCKNPTGHPEGSNPCPVCVMAGFSTGDVEKYDYRDSQDLSFRKNAEEMSGCFAQRDDFFDGKVMDAGKYSILGNQRYEKIEDFLYLLKIKKIFMRFPVPTTWVSGTTLRGLRSIDGDFGYGRVTDLRSGLGDGFEDRNGGFCHFFVIVNGCKGLFWLKEVEYGF